MGMDTHTIVDIVTLLSAVGSGVLAVYRSLSTRIACLEKQSAIHEGALRASGLLR